MLHLTNLTRLSSPAVFQHPQKLSTIPLIRAYLKVVLQPAMALAQFLHESDGLRAKEEFKCKDTGCPNDYKTPGCDAPGQTYYGRGYIQLTWCNNYKAASQDLYKDDRLVSDPKSVASNENYSWDTAFWFWKVISFL